MKCRAREGRQLAECGSNIHKHSGLNMKCFLYSLLVDIADSKQLKDSLALQFQMISKNISIQMSIHTEFGVTVLEHANL